MGESKKKCAHLKTQDASTVDPTKLTALSPDVVRFIRCLVIYSFRCMDGGRCRMNWLVCKSSTMRANDKLDIKDCLGQREDAAVFHSADTLGTNVDNL